MIVCESGRWNRGWKQTQTLQMTYLYSCRHHRYIPPDRDNDSCPGC